MAFLPLDGTAPRRDAPAMHAEILLFDGFDELDAMGPWEVLAGVAALRDDATARFVTLEGAREVRADHGAVVRAHRPRAPAALGDRGGSHGGGVSDAQKPTRPLLQARDVRRPGPSARTALEKPGRRT